MTKKGKAKPSFPECFGSSRDDDECEDCPWAGFCLMHYEQEEAH